MILLLFWANYNSYTWMLKPYLGVTNWPAGTARDEICPAKNPWKDGIKNMASSELSTASSSKSTNSAFFTHPKYIEYGFGYLQRLNMLCILHSICMHIYTLTWFIHVHQSQNRKFPGDFRSGDNSILEAAPMYQSEIYIKPGTMRACTGA